MIALFITVIMLMRVIQSVYNKRTAMLIPSQTKSYVTYLIISQYLSTAFSAITLVMSKNLSGFNAQAFLIAACSGGFLAVNMISGIKALLGGTIVLNSIFATAGLIVPCILGIFFFSESISLIQTLCIAAVILSAVMLIDSSKKVSGSFSPKTLFWLLTSFFSNGMVMFCQKLFGELQPNGNVSLFSMLTFLIPATTLLILYPFMPPRKEKAEKLPKKVYLYSAFLAFAVFIIQQFVTTLTPLMSSAMLFTIVNGGATVIAAIVGALLYKEKITLKSFFGILIGIAAMIIIKIA